MNKHRDYFARLVGWLLVMAIVIVAVYLRKPTEMATLRGASYQVSLALYPNSIGVFFHYNRSPGIIITQTHGSEWWFETPLFAEFKCSYENRLSTMTGRHVAFNLVIPHYALGLAIACLGALLPFPAGLRRKQA